MQPLPPLASRGLVTLVNPNFVKPGVTPYALDILCSHLEIAGFDVEVASARSSTSPRISPKIGKQSNALMADG